MLRVKEIEQLTFQRTNIICVKADYLHISPPPPVPAQTGSCRAFLAFIPILIWSFFFPSTLHILEARVSVFLLLLVCLFISLWEDLNSWQIIFWWTILWLRCHEYLLLWTCNYSDLLGPVKHACCHPYVNKNISTIPGSYGLQQQGACMGLT